MGTKKTTLLMTLINSNYCTYGTVLYLYCSSYHHLCLMQMVLNPRLERDQETPKSDYIIL